MVLCTTFQPEAFFRCHTWRRPLAETLCIITSLVPCNPSPLLRQTDRHLHDDPNESLLFLSRSVPQHQLQCLLHSQPVLLHIGEGKVIQVLVDLSNRQTVQVVVKEEEEEEQETYNVDIIIITSLHWTVHHRRDAMVKLACCCDSYNYTRHSSNSTSLLILPFSVS